MRRVVLLLPLVACAHARPVATIMEVPEVELAPPPPSPPSLVASDEAFADKLRAFVPHALDAMKPRKPFGDLRDPFDVILYPVSDRATTMWLIDAPQRANTLSREVAIRHRRVRVAAGMQHREATAEPDWTCVLLPATGR